MHTAQVLTWEMHAAGTDIAFLAHRDETGFGVVITRDVTADTFSAQADRRMWTWRCAKMTKTPWATDPTRYSFELSSCTGDGPTTTFP